MMKLENRRIAVLATDGFEQSELEKPVQALKEAGGRVDIVSLKTGEIKGWHDGQWGENVKVDCDVHAIKADDYDALLLPGGVINPDQLRKDDVAVEFVKGFFKKGMQKPVAAICHGPSTLINAEVVRDRKMTSYEFIKKDLMNAGAHWVDQEVVVDHGLVTSRSPEDLPAFNTKMVEEFCEGRHNFSENKKIS